MPTSKDELISAKKKLAEKNKNLLIEAKTKMNKINCIDASFAGGIDGMQITNKILSYSEVKNLLKIFYLNFDLKKLLKKGGSFYLLLIEENNPELIINLMENKFFCEVKIL